MNRAVLADFTKYLPFDPLKYGDSQTAIPFIAKDSSLVRAIEAAVQQIPTDHALHLGDARDLNFLAPNSVHLVITSPPYWTLKEYERVDGQLGFVEDYEAFLVE